MNIEERKELAGIICRACERVWNAIGYDVLAIEGVGSSVPAEDVVEMCVDADRLKTFGEPDADAAWDLLGEHEDFQGGKGYSKQLKFVASEMLYESYC